jgi:octaprenyl-diphosphate synthase
LNEVKASGGINYAMQIMEEYKSKSLTLLKEYPESSSRLALEKIIEFTIDRKK